MFRNGLMMYADAQERDNSSKLIIEETDSKSLLVRYKKLDKIMENFFMWIT